MQVDCKSIRFSILLVNYKTPDLTRICLEMLKKHLDEGALNHNAVDVWVLDNHSEDASVEYLRTLDWIKLVERTADQPEVGFVAHGNGLDLLLSKIETDYVFLMHTDTFVHSPSIFYICLSKMLQDSELVAVGCLHQINRGYIRFGWRFFTGFIKHYYRRCKLILGMASRAPSPYLEQHIKSFFALWNAKVIKQHNYKFLMGCQNPGYELQEKLTADGYRVEMLSPHFLFKFLDHVEGGTVGLLKGYTDKNRRSIRKRNLLESLDKEKR